MLIQHSNPTVSLIVPIFNEKPEILVQSLNSVAGQTLENFECLLIDDSTNDETRNCAANFCATDPRFSHVVPLKRLGLAASLNLGLLRSKADLIARFDADDICLPTRLEYQLSSMQNNPAIDVLGGALELVNNEGRTLGYRQYPLAHHKIMAAMQFTTPLAHPTVMMRKSVVIAAGGYDPSFRYAEDLELWLRMANRNARFANLPEVLVRYRQSDVRRIRDHWVCNFRARKKNFTKLYFFRRTVGIATIGLWSRLPPVLQEAIFHRMILRRRNDHE